MCATTSPIGVLTDPPVVGLATAVTATTALALARFHPSPPSTGLLWLLGLAPVVLALLIMALLLRARREVVRWLGALPFPVGNVNGLLNGVGVNLRIRFRGAVPTRETLDEALGRVDEDCFCLEFAEEEPEVQVRIGVLDSKFNPARAFHRRFRRVQRIIADALLPLAPEFVVEEVWVC
jgi:hypothetical protein